MLLLSFVLQGCGEQIKVLRFQLLKNTGKVEMYFLLPVSKEKKSRL